MSAAISLQNTRGALGLVGTQIDEMAGQALCKLELNKPDTIYVQPPYHITLFTKAELRQLSASKLSSIQPDTRHVLSAGVGGRPAADVLFVVVIWAAGQQLRKQFGLPPKHFHVTLSSKDDHEMDKGVESLLPGQFPDAASIDFLDHLTFTLHTFGQYQVAQERSEEIIRRFPESHRGFLRLGDAAFFDHRFKLSMLAYACAFLRNDDPKLQEYCLKKLFDCSKETEWGHVFTGSEMSQINGDIAPLLLTPWPSELRSRFSRLPDIPTLCLEPRHSLYIPHSHPQHGEPYRKLPRFFRWLVPFQIAVMSTPQNGDHIAALCAPHLGIRHVLTLTEETPLQKVWFQGRPIRNTFLPVPNTHPPSIEQVDLFIRLVHDEENRPLLIHCGGGKGRAGTVAACYLAAYGFNAPQLDLTQPTMSAEEAVTKLRAIRPGSIETDRQKHFVSKWCSTIWKRQSLFPDVPSEPPPCPLEVEGQLGNNHDLVILVGLPGSGKSFFAKSLVTRNPNRWTRVSQDDTGSRSSCETAIGRGGERLILDRCNSSSADRKSWLQLASHWTFSPICVWFDYAEDLCVSRAQMRPDHPTLPPGNRVRRAIEQMRNEFDRPSLKEGFKAIVTVRSFSAAHELIRGLSERIMLYKFPRTAHLLNLGAATGDDLHYSLSYVFNVPGNVVITEKVDGANMGLSLAEDRSTIVVQNRSHYVNSATHEQFKKLGAWLERHDDELRAILDRDEYFAERYILFGEWVYATHSIPYTHLSDRFIAFDLYDRSTRTFVDTRTLAALLAPTSIAMVPVLHEGPMPSEAELRTMVQRTSQFWEGRIEGVYVKVERDGRVVERGKVVRGDFITGNEHWTKGNLRVNGTRIS
ncbi:hypothetical protein HGRIS_008611 [Hohenbuehelia grisea]|uniref:ATP dependent DNA ligase n=1 Tax=Hohenbuehelia grisea TaxID=104357 RepID=A0ABR3J902_9AGAR